MSGMPMPPLALADEVGSVMHQVGKQTEADLGEAYEPNAATPVLDNWCSMRSRRQGGRRWILRLFARG